jgi:catechol 2,3-dioxygenase-like lactoylglutathione lyase family enzyme
VRLTLRLIPVVALLAVLASAVAVGQTPSTAKATVLGTGAFTAFVENMDRSLAFYHDAFGMEVPALPATGERTYNPANPQLFDMFDIAGAKERHQSARITGTRVSVEVMEIQNMPHQTINLRMQDPGNATLVLMVRDIDAALARAMQAKATIETPGGKPVNFADGTRAILIRDIDRRFIELRQPPSSSLDSTVPASDIFDMGLLITVNDMDETKRVYRDVLGFTVEDKTVSNMVRTLTGIQTTQQILQSRMQAPGSMLWIELIEFKGVDRTPQHMKIQDRGAARLQLRVQDIDVAVAAMKGAGFKVNSAGGVAVPIPPNLKGALVADPNNFFLTPYAPCTGCAPTTLPAAPAR